MLTLTTGKKTYTHKEKLFPGSSTFGNRQPLSNTSQKGEAD
jgi:hypothetical protein